MALGGRCAAKKATDGCSGWHQSARLVSWCCRKVTCCDSQRMERCCLAPAWVRSQAAGSGCRSTFTSLGAAHLVRGFTTLLWNEGSVEDCTLQPAAVCSW
jgi:hypothetical protein